MTDDWRPADMRAILEQLDQTIRDAESVRSHVERSLRRSPFWPERRVPKHWSERDVRSREKPDTPKD